jgi:hypothetical protein
MGSYRPLTRSITMGRTSHSNYIEAARQVLGELGGGPIASRDLVTAAQERGLVGNGNWVYHNFLRKVRDTDEFDTSRRGYVALADMGAPAADAGDFAPVAEVAAPVIEEAVVPTEELPVVTEENPFAETA